jgi:transketolase
LTAHAGLEAIAFGRRRHDPRRPDWANRDRIVLSKGHAVPALYTVMARAGYFPQSQVITLRKLGESPAETSWPLTTPRCRS